jgi:hypothetical protein
MSVGQATRKYSEIMEMYRDPISQSTDLYLTLEEVHGELQRSISTLKHHQFNAGQEYRRLTDFYLVHGEVIPESDYESLDESLGRIDRHVGILKEYREKQVRDLVEKLIRVM